MTQNKYTCPDNPCNLYAQSTDLSASLPITLLVRSNGRLWLSKSCMYNSRRNILSHAFWTGLDTARKSLDNGVKVLVGSPREVVLPVSMDVMDWDGRGGAVGGRRTVGGVGKSHAVSSPGAQEAGGAGVGRPRSASLAESGVLPVGAVGLGAGPEKGVLGVVVGLGGDMATEKVVSA